MSWRLYANGLPDGIGGSPNIQASITGHIKAPPLGAIMHLISPENISEWRYCRLMAQIDDEAVHPSLRGVCKSVVKLAFFRQRRRLLDKLEHGARDEEQGQIMAALLCELQDKDW